MDVGTSLDDGLPDVEGNLSVIFDGVGQSVDEVLGETGGLEHLGLVLLGRLGQLLVDGLESLLAGVPVGVDEAVDGPLEALN